MAHDEPTPDPPAQRPTGAATDPATDSAERIAALERELFRMRKVNQTLMAQVERDMDKKVGAFSLFQAATMLEDKVRSRTEELTTTMTTLEAMNAELKRARDVADAASRAKSEFLANMSHEIRTPMNGVLGMAELLLATELTPRQHNLTENIQRSAVSLLAVINDILDFSKVEAGRLELEDTELDVRDVIEDTLELLARSAHVKGLELVTSIPPGARTRLRGDPGRLRQIITNLVGNAIKFTDAGHVVVSVTDRGLCRDDLRELQIDVTDTGIGIARDVIGRLFTAFTQADGSMSRRYGGSGLGLVIVRKLCRLMHGDVTVTSEPGRGSTFSVVVRLGPGAPAEIDDEGEFGAAVVAGRRALIVEPSAPARRALADLLGGFGVVCETVGSSDAAAACLAAGDAGPRYDLVLSSVPLAGELGPPAVLIRLVRDGERAPHGQPIAIELPKPVRRWRLIGVLRHALGAAPPPRRRGRTPFPITTGLRRMLGLRVLVAEDNAINREVTTGMLADLGCTAMCVSDGQQVLEALARESFDLVLMDCQMPVMDGFEATRALRRREAGGGAHQVVIAVTANATAEDREACRVAGMDDFLSKPFRRRELASVLARHLPNQAPPPAGAPPAPAGAPPAPAAPQVARAAPAPDRALADRAVLDRAVLDRIRAIQRPGRPDLVRRVLQLFLERSPAQLEAIADAAAAGDATRLIRAAHDLKGASGNVGLLQLSELVAHIEQLAKQNRLAEAAPLLAELPTLSAAATSAVRGELEHCPPTREPDHV